MSIYLEQKKKEKTWNENSFVENLSHPLFLKLEQIKYNFLHELALKKDKKLIYEII